MSALALVACTRAVSSTSDGGWPARSPPDAEAVDLSPRPPDGNLAADLATHHGAVDAGPACAKQLTVVFSVGVGAGAVASLSNGCWKVVDADGAANHAFRKCSTSSFVVVNPNAGNWAYDDTNPSRPLSQDQSFLDQCSSGAGGDGYEYMAYRGSWRILPAPNRRAYFAELYGDQTDDVDSLRAASGVWQGNPQLQQHHDVYPMINIGPSPGAHLEGQIEAEALALCRAVPDRGYFGTYVATWQLGMSAGDPRAVAVAQALNACTR